MMAIARPFDAAGRLPAGFAARSAGRNQAEVKIGPIARALP
jgi:hypothetical protein